jgi:HlyD family secretion protein
MGPTVAADSQTLPLFVIAADLTLAHIDAIVNGRNIGAVTLGDKASFSVVSFPNHPSAGEVTKIPQSPQAYQHVATYDVVISAPNPDLLLEPGMAATIRIVSDRRDDRAPNQTLRYWPRDLPISNGSGSPWASPSGSSQLWILRNGKPTAAPSNSVLTMVATRTTQSERRWLSTNRGPRGRSTAPSIRVTVQGLPQH